MSDTQQSRVPVLKQVREMPANFWVANLLEAGERLAFFGVRAVLPIYMAGEQSALHLSMTEKGLILGVWALIQCLVPMISGGYTEAYGYKKSLYVAFAINIGGYVVMANSVGFWSMMAAGVLVGTGTAIFKPPVQGMVAKSLNDGNSGLGFGIFYWLVNIGGFFAPMLASFLRGDPEFSPTWSHVFYGAAVVTAINYLPALFLFREPEVDPNTKGKSPLAVFKETMLTLWRDSQMLRFLLVISGFWFMFMQLWDLLPNFIVEWVDTRDVGAGLHYLLGDWASGWLLADGSAKQELLINIDSFTILLLVLPLAWFFGKYRMMVALATGMAIAVLGFVGAGLTSIGWVCALMIFVFAIGEIICSPKFSEYIGMTAPPDKKAIYMGYSNIPFAVGWFAGNILSGPMYDMFSSRTKFARDYMIDHLGMTAEQVAAIDPSQITQTMADHMGNGATTYDATRVLWEAHHPWIIWLILGGVGLASLIAMLIMSRGIDAKLRES